MPKFAIIILLIAVVAAIALIETANSVPRANHPDLNSKKYAFMLLTSPQFNNNADIPQKFTCDGGDINPELQIHNVPEGAESLALIVDDSDATRGGSFTHWLVWNISPGTTSIKQESVPPGAIEGTNDFPNLGYGGPCPPKGSAPHHYHFKLYALDAKLDLPQGSEKSGLEAEISKHLLSQTELIGLYNR